MRLARNAALAAEVVGTWVRVRLALRGTDLPSTLAALRRAGGGRRPADPVRLSAGVQRTLALLPADTRCLTQSLVLARLLAVRGMRGTVVIGVTPDEKAPFGAHAWVELDGRPLLPSGDHQRLVEL